MIRTIARYFLILAVLCIYTEAQASIPETPTVQPQPVITSPDTVSSLLLTSELNDPVVVRWQSCLLAYIAHTDSNFEASYKDYEFCAMIVEKREVFRSKVSALYPGPLQCVTLFVSSHNSSDENYCHGPQEMFYLMRDDKIFMSAPVPYDLCLAPGETGYLFVAFPVECFLPNDKIVISMHQPQ